MSEEPRKYIIRTKYLIDPVLQLKIVGILASICIAAASTVFVVIHNRLYQAAAFMKTQGIPNEAIEEVARARDTIGLAVILVFLVAMVLFIAVSLFLTHKVAGPMIKLRNALRSHIAGEPFSPLTYRNDDEFQEALGMINQVLTKK